MAQHGEALYNASKCRSCHRIGSTGGNPGPDLSLVGLRRSREWLQMWLSNPQAWKHDAKMPNLKLSSPENKAIAEYLVSLRGQIYLEEKRPWEKPPRIGQRIYQKAGCVACHGTGGEGGQPNNNVAGGLIPALRSVVHTYTAQELKDKIRKGSVPVKNHSDGPEPLVRMPAWGEILSDQELDAVTSYLFTFKSEPMEEW